MLLCCCPQGREPVEGTDGADLLGQVDGTVSESQASLDITGTQVNGRNRSEFERHAARHLVHTKIDAVPQKVNGLICVVLAPSLGQQTVNGSAAPVGDI
ncbi:hypothetical protein [Krasilnikovia sp. M28-CT-15]|uniref:hypothetical protein n=1 Tax=Krasilnikovia sp. M28-CT-15 TaxID=3373540 RepID=UPI00387769CE